MNVDYRRREIFLLRFSGWFCLFPASVYLYLYQMTHMIFCLGELVIIVLFAVYLLTTAKSERWTNAKCDATIDFCLNLCGNRNFHPIIFCISQL